jgi:hypothetical protein
MKFIPKGPASKPQMQAKSQQNSEDDAKKKTNYTFPSTVGIGSAQGLGLKPLVQALTQQPSPGHEQL